MIFVPTAHKPVKILISAIVLGMIGIKALFEGRLFLHRSICLWTLLMVCTGLVFMMVGISNDTPGAMRVGTVYVLSPLVFTVFVAGIANVRVVERLFKVMVAGTLAIELYAVNYLLHAIGWLPYSFHVELFKEERVGSYSYEGLYKGTFGYYLPSIASLIFLVPFTISALLTWPKQSKTPVRPLWLWGALALGLALTLLSGRRSLLVAVGISPIIVLMCRMLLPGKGYVLSRTGVVCGVAGIAFLVGSIFVSLRILLGIDVQAMFEYFMKGFEFMTDSSAYARREQFLALLEGWAASPLVGAGHGAVAGDVVRSLDMPWSYELTYLALLFHTGLIGFGLYSAAVLWVVWEAVRVIRAGGRLAAYTISALVGMICFLIANGTNPYLEKYDFLWMIFLPIALINLWRMRQAQTSVGVLNSDGSAHWQVQQRR